jgi:hypothetical protein
MPDISTDIHLKEFSNVRFYPRQRYGPRHHRRESALRDIARISHQPSTATAQCRTLHDFSSVRVLNIVLTMSAHSSVAKVMQGTAFRRLATKAGEKCGLDQEKFTGPRLFSGGQSRPVSRYDDGNNLSLCLRQNSSKGSGRAK